MEYKKLTSKIESINNKPWNDTLLWKIILNGQEYGYFSKTFEYQVGDEITILYEEKGQYRSIKEIVEYKDTSLIVDKKDIEQIKSIFLMDKDMAKITLISRVIDLCIKRGTLTDEEIWASYERFKKGLNIEL